MGPARPRPQTRPARSSHESRRRRCQQCRAPTRRRRCPLPARARHAVGPRAAPPPPVWLAPPARAARAGAPSTRVHYREV
eukprot:scaffold10051_cov90-Isochrysis_galbana.AAC.6